MEHEVDVDRYCSEVILITFCTALSLCFASCVLLEQLFLRARQTLVQNPLAHSRSRWVALDSTQPAPKTAEKLPRNGREAQLAAPL